MDNEGEDEVIFGQAASEICKEHLGAMLIVRDNNMLLTGGTDINHTACHLFTEASLHCALQTN